MKTLVVTLVVALEVDAVSWKPARGMRQVWKWESSGIERWNRRQKAIAYRHCSRQVDDEPKSQRGLRTLRGRNDQGSGKTNCRG